MKNPFTAKAIVFEAIRQKLKGTGINKIILIFNIDTEKYSVMLQNEENKSMKVEVEKDDITKLKKMFIDKIKSKIDKQISQRYSVMILQLNFIDENFDIFVELENKDVIKIDL